MKNSEILKYAILIFSAKMCFFNEKQNVEQYGCAGINDANEPRWASNGQLFRLRLTSRNLQLYGLSHKFLFRMIAIFVRVKTFIK